MLQRTTEVEAAVLGDIFLFDDLNEKILLLENDDFSSETLKNVYTALKKIYDERGYIPQEITLGTLDAATKTALMGCADGACFRSTFNDTFAELKRAASSRRLSAQVSELIAGGCCTVDCLRKIADDEAQKKTDVDTGAEKAGKTCREYLRRLKEPKDLVKTGFAELDCMISGIEHGTFFLIGARPSTGKTTFALNLAANMIKAGRRVFVFSLEMNDFMVYDRILANKLDIDYRQFIGRDFDEYQEAQIEREITKIESDKKLLAFDDVNTVENICSYIYREKPDVAIVDFIQCVNTSKQFNDTRTQINYISSELKWAAKRTGCVVIALSQLSRMGKDAPTMSDLRESGALEQDGDYIILLHRPFVADKTKDPAETEVLIDKNKFGRTGLLNFYFDGKHQRFNGCFGSEKEAENAELPFH